MKTNVTLSEDARAAAERRAREEGFDSVEAYIDALIEEDRESATVLGWMRERIRDGLASPNAGELTRDKLNRLVNEGIARAAPKG
jgi:hypothetical protein